MARKKTARRPAKKASRATTRKPARPAPRAARPTRTPRKPARKPAARPAARASAAPAVNAAQRELELLRWTHDLTRKLLADWPADKLTYQCALTDNHVLWTLGHMAMTYAWCASLLDGRPVGMSDSYSALFGPSSKPDPDAAAYPSPDELRRALDDAFTRLADAGAALSAADATKPPVAEAYGFAHDRADVLAKTAWHEGWHAGQLSSLRRVLGLPRIM